MPWTKFSGPAMLAVAVGGAVPGVWTESAPCVAGLIILILKPGGEIEPTITRPGAEAPDKGREGG